MSANKEIRILMLQEGLTITKLVKIIEEKTGIKYTPDGMAKKLRNNTLKYTEVEVIANSLDYDIDFIKRKIAV